MNILEAARKSGTVRRAVITSSIKALIPFPEIIGERRCANWVEPSDRIPFVAGRYKDEFEAYAASKVAALRDAEAWMEINRPVFDVVHLHPSFVEGRNDLAMQTREVLKGTNAIIMSIAMGKKFQHSTMGVTVDLEDVARVHVQALDMDKVPGNSSYILSQSTEWEEVTEIVGKCFPDAVKKGILPNTGDGMSHPIFVDAGKTEEVFGVRFRGLEEQVRSVVGHYLEVRMVKKKSLGKSVAR